MKMQKNKAQVMLEFSFCMIIVMLMIYGMIKLFRWSGIDLVGKSKLYESSLTQSSDAGIQLQVPTYNYSAMNTIFDK